MFWGHGLGQDYNALQGLEAVVRAAAKAHSLVKKTDREEILVFYVCGTPASCLFRNESAVTLICSVVPFLSFCLLSFKMENGSRRGWQYVVRVLKWFLLKINILGNV